MTPHNEAKVGEIAKIVLMPGDPLRAKYIAEKYLENYHLVNQKRGIYAFTGIYKGREITVMASGMGIPSMGIYSYELYEHYGVECIIRIGSCGSYQENLHLKDLVLVTSCYSESTYAKVQDGTNEDCLKPNCILNEKIRECAKTMELPIIEGRIYCSDVFYEENTEYQAKAMRKGCIATEMESFALFHNANHFQKKAACILTVSDQLITGERATAEERETSLEQMIHLALEVTKEL